MAAQRPPERVSHPAALVPADHWSVDALRRLHGLGLTPAGFDPGRANVTQQRAGEVFAGAAREAPENLAALVNGWRSRFDAEFGTGSDRSTLSLLTGSAAAGGYAARDGALRRGWGYVDGYPPGTLWQGPTPVEDRSEAVGRWSAQVNPLPWLSLRYSDAVPATFADQELYGSFVAGPVAGWVGERGVRYGPGRTGGIVLNASESFPSVGVRSNEPFRLPWVLRHVGPVHLDLLVGQTDLPRSYDDVALLATRASAAPHPRLLLGVSRAAMFGGDGNTNIDAFSILSVLIGKHAGEISELDNQVVAVDVDYRPPVERWLPLRLYLEWGFEDSAGAYTNVPGILAGVEIPALPGVPALRLGLERTSFAPSCCGNPVWYRHATFLDGWVIGTTPIGHPLGGHGTEWALLGGADLAGAAVRLDASVFVRERRTENVYAPAREGESRGATAAAEWLLLPGIELRLSGRVEDGAGWRETAASIALRAFL